MVRRYEPNLAVRNVRAEVGLSQEELGSLMGVTHEPICNYEVGRARAPLVFRENIANMFGRTERHYRQKALLIRRARSDVVKPEMANERFRDIIYRAGLTQNEVCVLAGYSKGGSLANYMAGRFSISLTIAERIAPVIGCSVKELVSPEWERYNLKDSGLDEKRGDGVKFVRIENIGGGDSFSKWVDECRLKDVKEMVHYAMEKLPEEDRTLLERVFRFSNCDIFERERFTLEGFSKETNVDGRGGVWFLKERAQDRFVEILYRSRFRDMLPAHGAEV